MLTQLGTEPGPAQMRWASCTYREALSGSFSLPIRRSFANRCRQATSQGQRSTPPDFRTDARQRSCHKKAQGSVGLGHTHHIPILPTKSAPVRIVRTGSCIVGTCAGRQTGGEVIIAWLSRSGPLARSGPIRNRCTRLRRMEAPDCCGELGPCKRGARWRLKGG
jgi:hypothetical protein